ncbi:TnaB [Neisseria gonorrhoeae]|uniref:TnaB n=1 Tax=Neisseria gonorrhoeae TaxID=485 RepID=A0A378W123_NEIGO|nr:TnaB [Neisseria gonorrhoeae]
MVKDLLGRGWNIINGIAVAFVYTCSPTPTSSSAAT